MQSKKNNQQPVYRPKTASLVNNSGSNSNSQAAAQSQQRQQDNIGSSSGAAQQQNEAINPAQTVQEQQMPVVVAQSNDKKYEMARNWTLLSSREQLQVGNFVDAKDTVNNWCVGQIVQENVDQGMVTVHFEGWSDRYDVIIKKNSNKMAPFRSQTRGYTGQRRNAFRDFKLNQAQQIIIEKKVQMILESRFGCFQSAHECTQFIRGELYVHVDSLITLASTLQASDLPGILEFIKLVFNLLLTWMETFPHYAEAFKECRQYPLLFCVDLPAAISQCCYELVELLGKIWGQCHRARSFFDHFKDEYLQSGTFARSDKIASNGMGSSITNIFGEVNGFQRTIAVLKGNEENTFPLDLTGLVLTQFTLLPNFVEKQQANLFASEISQTLMHRLDNLSDKEIKDLDRQMAQKVLRVLEAFIKIYQPHSNVYEISETYELTIAQKYLMSPYFDKKIRGMAEFKDIFNKVEARQRYNENEIRSGEISVCRFLNFQNFSSWISETQVLEYIFVENPHSELIKRSIELTYLRAIDNENPLQDHLIDAIWRCATEKHEDTIRATLSAIEHLIQFLQLEKVERFYTNIKQLPVQKFDDMRIDFLHNYTVGAMNALVKQRQYLTKTGSNNQSQQQSQSTGKSIKNFFGGKKQKADKDPANLIDASKYLDLNKFWLISQDTNTDVPHKTRQRALGCLIEILKRYSHEKVFMNQMSKIDFMNLALENIANNNSMYTSITFLQSLIITYPRESSSGGRNYSQYGGRNQSAQPQTETRERIVQQLIDQDIFTKLIGNSTNYQKVVAQNQVTQAQIDEVGGKENLALFGDKMSHKEYIDCFIGFIEFIITSSKNGNLSFANLQAMFKTFVTNCSTEYEQKVFFNFLTKENESAMSRERKFLLDERRRTDVFQKIMCNNNELDCTRLGIEGFRCFKMLFLNVNAEHRHINHNPKTDSFEVIDIVHFQNLLGLDTLWSIAIQSKDSKVADESRNFLVDIHLKSIIEQKHKKVFVESFLKKIEVISLQLSQLQTNKAEDSDMRLNWVTLIRTYISRFDFMHIPLEDFKKYDEKNNVKVSVQLDPDNVTQEIVVNQNMQIWQIVVQTSRIFGLKISEFQIITKKGPLDQSIYYDAVSAYVIKQLQIMRVDEQKLNNENPRRVIGQDKLFLTQLLSLLAQMADQEKVAREIISLLEELPVNLEMQGAFNKQIQRIPSLETVVGGVQVSDEQNQKLWSEIFSQIREGDSPEQQKQVIPSSTYHNLLLLQECILGGNSSRRVKAKTVSGASAASGNASNSSPETVMQFMQSFIERGGFTFLTNFFIQIDKSRLEHNTIKNKSIQLLIEILTAFLSNRNNAGLKDKMSMQSVYDLFYQNVLVMQNFVQAVEMQQSNFVEGSRAMKSDHNLITISLQLTQKMMFWWPQLMKVISEQPNIDQFFQTTFLKLQSERIQQKIANCFLEICRKLDVDLPKNIHEEQKANGGNSIFTNEAGRLNEETAAQLPSIYFMRLFWTQYLRQLIQIQKDTIQTKELFSFMTKLMQETQVGTYLEVIFEPSQFVTELSQMIKQRPIIETGATVATEDCVLTGIFYLLKATLRKRPDVRASFPQKEDLLHYMLHECLFHKETDRTLIIKDQGMPPKCKSKNSRYACLSLVKELTVDNQVGVRTLVEYMRKTIYSSNVSWHWRTPRGSDWTITTNDKQEKSITGYVGLKNIGCICYMNSIMQQLFMITPFRKAMLEVEDVNSLTEPESTNVLYQIKRIFCALMELEKQYFNPKKFCMAFKDIDGSPIDPMVQRDVDEFFNMLIDRIENLIKGTKEEKVMKNLLYGQFANEFICKGCPHYSEREEQFMAIPLQVKNKKSILEGLETFVEGEMLEGDNAYYCEKCELKRDTLKRCSIKRLPNVLFLELKRFEFNFDTMQKYKVNDYCSFPMDLDMKPYSQEYISRQDLIKEMNDKNLTMEDLSMDQTILMNRTVTDQYFKYKLKGVVVHNGTSDSGHYYAFIKDREETKGDEDGKWYEFNDTYVGHFDSRLIPEETFGGENENFEAQVQQYANDPAMQQILANQGRQKTKNAYILIYERLCFIDQEKFNEFTDDVNVVMQNKGSNAYERASANFFTACRLPRTVDSQIQITPSIHEKMLEKNKRFWLTRFIFNRTFLDQSLEIFRGFNFQTDQNYQLARNTNLQLMSQAGVNVNEDQLEIMKYVVTFTLTVAFRASIRTQIPYLIRIIRKAMINNVRLSLWFCEIFSNQQIIKEFFVDCTIPDMARFTAGLLKTAMQNLYNHEKDLLASYTQKLEQGNIVEQILQMPGDNLVSHSERSACHVQNNESSQANSMTPQGTPDGSNGGQTTHGGPERTIYSACDTVNVICLHSGHSQQLPLLVTLINSFLHFQSSPHLQQSVNFSHHLHSFVAHFASLGPIARHYLLKTRTLARLLKILLTYNNSANLPQSQINETQIMHDRVPLIEILRQGEGESGGGYLTANMMLGVDQKLQVKERYAIIQTMQSPMVFVIYAISLLARSCKFVNNAQRQPGSATDEGPAQAINNALVGSSKGNLYNGMVDPETNEHRGHSLDKDELDLLINYIANRVWWRSSAQEFPMVRNSVSSMFGYVSMDNKEFSHVYIQEIFKVMAVSNFMIVKKYERPLLILVRLTDAYQKERITRILNNLYEVFRKNTMYWKFCDSLIELTYKLANRCRMFAAEMSKSKNLLNMISTITKENPSFPYNQGRQKIFRDGVINWQHINKDKKLVNQGKVDWITNYSKQRLEQLNKVVELGKQMGEQAVTQEDNQLTTSTAGDDSDDDFYAKVPELGSLVDVWFDRGSVGWFPAKVIFTLQEMVKVQTTFTNDAKQECWVELESAKIAKHGSYTRNDKMVNHIYFQDLYKLIEPTINERQNQQSRQ